MHVNSSVSLAGSNNSGLKQPQNANVPKSKFVYELDQWEIPDLQHIVEDQMIVSLREEKAREWKKKEEEVKIKQIQEKEKEIARIDNKRNLKEIDGKKFTFDVNGEAIPIKNVVVEKLANDFTWPK